MTCESETSILAQTISLQLLIRVLSQFQQPLSQRLVYLTAVDNIDEDNDLA